MSSITTKFSIFSIFYCVNWCFSCFLCCLAFFMTKLPFTPARDTMYALFIKMKTLFLIAHLF